MMVNVVCIDKLSRSSSKIGFTVISSVKVHFHSKTLRLVKCV